MSNVPSTKHDQLIQALNLPPLDDDSVTFHFESLLAVGSHVGESIHLQGHPVTRVQLDLPPRVDKHSESEPAPTFEVVRKLGTGSYAVVWLVREVLHDSDSDSSLSTTQLAQPTDDDDDDNIFDFDPISSSSSSDSSSPPHSAATSPTTSNSSNSPKSGRYFALKCLSKANLDDDALTAQLLEANIHQSLPIHPNIVTLYRTLETPDYLLLLLEYVPGQDLFYFLESARDSLPSNNTALDYTQCGSLSKTPTSPSLLSSSTLLSHQRLRLIASMFAQMCLAVAACHKEGVYHRDIKPENFIVTESRHPDPERANERRVVVKLTDFGLATRESESCDMDCGSAPYMSFECRNNLAPSYRPQPADIWSLGIVLINMLYHHNPWSDTSLHPEFRCPSFDSYRMALDKGAWFEGRFKGIGAGENDAGGWLARSVFCFLDDGRGDDVQFHVQGNAKSTSQRVTAEEFGNWAKDLPMLLGRKAFTYGIAPTVSNLSIERVGRSRRPSLRSVNGVSWIGFGPPRPPSSTQSLRSIGVGTTGMGAHHRRPSVGPPPLGDPDIDNVHDGEFDFEREFDSLDLENEDDQSRYGDGAEGEGESTSRAASATRRRKRGARNKSKGGASHRERDASLHGEREREDDAESMVSSITGTPGDKLDDMAVKSQLLARELSKASSWVSVSSGGGSAAGSRSRLPTADMDVPESEKLEEPAPLPATGTVKKKGWRGLWKMTSSEALSSAFSSSSSSSTSTTPPVPPLPSNVASGSTATNVTKLVMSLDARLPPNHSSNITNSSSTTHTSASVSSLPPTRIAPHRMPHGPGSAENGFARGRKSKEEIQALKAYSPPQSPWSPQPRVEFVPRHSSSKHPNPHNRSPLVPVDARTQSPNWRNSVSTNSTTSTGFTRYSNGSTRSLETVATSASGASSASWRDRNPNPNNNLTADNASDISRRPKGKTKEPEQPPTPTSATSATSTSSNSSQLDNAPTVGPRRRPATSHGSRSTTPTTPRPRPGPNTPPNIKVMDGVPWELTMMPWQLHQRPSGDISAQAYIPRTSLKYKQGRAPAASPALDTISEQPTPAQAAQNWRQGRQSPPASIAQRKDASTSTTDLTEPQSPTSPIDDPDGRKSLKQNNTLHKMLSALRR